MGPVFLVLHWLVLDKSRLGKGYRDAHLANYLKPINDAIQPYKEQTQAAQEQAQAAKDQAQDANERAQVAEDAVKAAEDDIVRIRSNPNLHQGLS